VRKLRPGSEYVSIRTIHGERSEPDQCTKGVFVFVTQLVFTHRLRFCSSHATRWQKESQTFPPSSSSSVSIPYCDPNELAVAWRHSSAHLLRSRAVLAFVSRPSRAPKSLHSFYSLTHAHLQSVTVVQARQPSSRCGAFLISRDLQTHNATSERTYSWYLTASYDWRV